jgi:hypothetical protein
MDSTVAVEPMHLPHGKLLSSLSGCHYRTVLPVLSVLLVNNSAAETMCQWIPTRLQSQMPVAAVAPG